jgi:ABC-type glycerol-3-phosphate transport system substrate-binding protein
MNQGGKLVIGKSASATDRRRFLKRTASLAAIGITTSLTPELAFGQAETDLKGVTIDYWNMIGVQNKLIREISQNIITAFEQRTGCKVNVTWNGYGDIIGPKYRTNFVGGIKPTVLDTSARWAGQLHEFTIPLEDLIMNDLDAEARSGIEWLFPLLREQTKGFADGDKLNNLPFNILTQAPYLLNRDHLEKAGLSFDEHFPLRDSDHYIEVCKAIQSKAGIAYPTEVYGKIWDFGDTQLPGWVRSVSVEDSDFLTADWSKSTARSEAWQKGCQFYVDVFRKYGLSSPNSVQSADEEAVDQFIIGRKSIVHCDLLNRGTMLQRLPEQVKSGRIVWGPNFPLTGATSGSQGFTDANSFYIVRQEGPDAEIKTKAAWEFMKEWMRPDNMIAQAEALGLCARRDLWPKLQGTPDLFMKAAEGTLGDKPGIWAAHPKSVDFQYNLLAPHGQRMLQGESVKAELDAYADEVDKSLAA